MDENYTDRALAALTEAAAIEPDFNDWLDGVLARAAAGDDQRVLGLEPLISSADLRTAHRGTDRPLPG